MTATGEQIAGGAAPNDGAALAGAGVRLTANELRRLAEAADGMRGGVCELAFDGPGRARIRQLKPEEVGQVPAGAILVETAKKARNRQVPVSAVLNVAEGQNPEPLRGDKYDLVLWGEAAAEKFLVPYYVRFYNDDEMAKLRAAIADDDVLAIAHIYPTFWETVRTEGRLSILAAGESTPSLDELEVLTRGRAEKGQSFIALADWFRSR